MNNIIDKILAIVVVYNQDLSKSQTLISLGDDIQNEQSSLDLFIYDNSSAKRKDFAPKGFNVLAHFHDGNNVGVSAAYNEAVRFAQSIDKEWVLLLDQDTSFGIGALKMYLDNINSNPDVNIFSPIIKLENGSIFSPFGKCFKRGFVLKNVEPIRYSLKTYSPVNSGILVKVDSFTMVDGYNEKVKLDFSDIEFIRRISKYEKEFKVIDLICFQDFSNDDTNIENLNNRFAFFCDGAKNSYRKNLFENFQYLIVVMIRMTMLVKRTRNFIFIKTFFKNYIK